MPATAFIFSFIEYLKGARSEPEIEIGREVISRNGFWPTWVQTPARKDPTRDFKMQIEFTAERAEFFPTFIPGNARKSILSGNRTRALELEDGEEGVLCVLERIEDDALQFTLMDLWGPVHITSFPAKNWQEIIQHFSGSRRFAGPTRNFFWKELREQRLEETKQKLVDEEQKRAEEEEKKQERKKGLLGQLMSLTRGGWKSR